MDQEPPWERDLDPHCNSSEYHSFPDMGGLLSAVFQSAKPELESPYVSYFFMLKTMATLASAQPFSLCGADLLSGKALGVRILQAVLQNMSAVEMQTPENLKPGKEGDRFVTIQPAKKTHYTGIVTKDKDISPVTIGGTWYPRRPSPGRALDVILHFHGGRLQATYTN